MFDIPLDAWYVWVGLAIASGSVFGVASAMPAAAPPEATEAAETVDSVAASRYAAVGDHPVPNADAARIGAESLSLRGGGGTTHARFRYGPVTPARGSERLADVLEGAPPESRFDSPTAFERTANAARSDAPTWRNVDRISVRRVSWEGVDVVLVG